MNISGINAFILGKGRITKKGKINQVQNYGFWSNFGERRKEKIEKRERRSGREGGSQTTDSPSLSSHHETHVFLPWFERKSSQGWKIGKRNEFLHFLTVSPLHFVPTLSFLVSSPPESIVFLLILHFSFISRLSSSFSLLLFSPKSRKAYSVSFPFSPFCS